MGERESKRTGKKKENRVWRNKGKKTKKWRKTDGQSQREMM